MLKKRMLLLGCCDALPLRKLCAQGWQTQSAISTTDARRRLSQGGCDLIVAQLERSQDGLAKDLLELCAISQISGLALVPPEKVDILTYQFRQAPIMVLPLLAPAHVLLQVLDYLGKEAVQHQVMQESLNKEKRRLQDERLVSQAKLQLVSHCRWSEEKAHQYILKTAMDNSLTKAAAAKIVLRKVEVLLSENSKNQCHASS